MIRNTQQRSVILETLSLHRDHPTAEELFYEIREQLPRISLGTVYRNLDLLSRKGEIRRIDNAAGPSRYDPVNDSHPHFRCPSCNKIFDLPLELSVEHIVNTKILNEHGFETEGLVLELQKICSECSGADS